MEVPLDRLAHAIQGTCMSVEAAAELCGLDAFEDWEDRLLDRNVERCGGCGWWMESGELEFDESAGHGVCDQCRDS